MDKMSTKDTYFRFAWTNSSICDAAMNLHKNVHLLTKLETANQRLTVGLSANVENGFTWKNFVVLKIGEVKGSKNINMKFC